MSRLARSGFAPRKYQTQPAANTISDREAEAKRRERSPPYRLGGLRRRWLASFERIDPDGLLDVLELCRAEVGHSEIEPPFDLPVGLLGDTDRARLANALQSRGDIDPVAHQVAVALLDDVAQMNADAELDAALGRQAGVALGHAVLHFDGAAHGVDHAAELDENAVAGSFDDASVMRVDGGIDQIAAQPTQARERAILVRSREPAVADDVRDQKSPRFFGFPPWRPHAPRGIAQGHAECPPSLRSQ